MVRAELDRTLKRWGGTLLTTVVLAGLIVLTGAAHRAAAGSERFVVRPDVAAVLECPSWLDPRAAQVLAHQLGDDLTPASLLDPDGLLAWRAQLGRLSPWVAGVETLEASFPGRAEVRLRLRHPVLQLPEGELVASDGIVLGRAPVALDPPALRVDGQLGAGALEECAAAAAELLPFRATLAEQALLLDAVTLEEDGQVVFSTRDGVELEWGRSARQSAFAAVDLSPAARVEQLLEVARRHPGLIGVRRVRLWLERAEVVLQRRG